MKKNNYWFTFVELIVTSVILVILTTTWFYSYIGYLSEARDSERKSDLAKVNSSIKLYKQKRWSYPMPWDSFNIVNLWWLVAYQWKLNNNVSLSTLDKIPLDPFINTNYSYSITKNKQEYQVALSYENWDFPIAWLDWDYKSVSRNVLPTIILAYSWSLNENVEINSSVWFWSTNRNYFIFDAWYNLPYSFLEPYPPYYNEIPLDTVLISDTINFWQNSDYRSCTEIEEAWKAISGSWVTQEYQILNSSWALTNTWCTF